MPSYIRDALEQADRGTPVLARAGPRRKLILVTAHRRESFGDGFERICPRPAEIAGLPDVQIVYPVHPNPNVSEPVTAVSPVIPTSA